MFYIISILGIMASEDPFNTEMIQSELLLVKKCFEVISSRDEIKASNKFISAFFDNFASQFLFTMQFLVCDYIYNGKVHKKKYIIDIVESYPMLFKKNFIIGITKKGEFFDYSPFVLPIFEYIKNMLEILKKHGYKEACSSLINDCFSQLPDASSKLLVKAANAYIEKGKFLDYGKSVVYASIPLYDLLFNGMINFEKESKNIIFEIIKNKLVDLTLLFRWLSNCSKLEDLASILTKYFTTTKFYFDDFFYISFIVRYINDLKAKKLEDEAKEFYASVVFELEFSFALLVLPQYCKAENDKKITNSDNISEKALIKYSKILTASFVNYYQKLLTKYLPSRQAKFLSVASLREVETNFLKKRNISCVKSDTNGNQESDTNGNQESIPCFEGFSEPCFEGFSELLKNELVALMLFST